MNCPPKIYLVHALPISMEPISASFRSYWPEARVAHLLDDSLFGDFDRDNKVITDAMIERFRRLGDYCVAAGADAIMFTCSVFGRAIEAVQHDHGIPVLKSNEALYEDLMGRGGRVALLATFAATLSTVTAEIEACMTASGVRLKVAPHLVEGALDALFDNRPDEHNRLIAEAAARFADHDAIAFTQFSMAPALELAQARVRTPILTPPNAAIRKMKSLMGIAGQSG
jgi:Asp/Glu/hydantoin racemase